MIKFEEKQQASLHKEEVLVGLKDVVGEFAMGTHEVQGCSLDKERLVFKGCEKCVNDEGRAVRHFVIKDLFLAVHG